VKKILGYGAAGVVLVALLVSLTFGLGGWVLMLLLGAVHHSVWATVPALGYWQSVIVYMLLSLVAGLFKGASK
jgi:hypothetical protein